MVIVMDNLWMFVRHYYLWTEKLRFKMLCVEHLLFVSSGNGGQTVRLQYFGWMAQQPTRARVLVLASLVLLNLIGSFRPAYWRRIHSLWNAEFRNIIYKLNSFYKINREFDDQHQNKWTNHVIGCRFLAHEFAITHHMTTGGAKGSLVVRCWTMNQVLEHNPRKFTATKRP
jgi:hypothetical protein